MRMPRPSKKTKYPRVNLTLPPAMKRQARELADKLEEDLSAMVQRLLRDEIIRVRGEYVEHYGSGALSDIHGEPLSSSVTGDVPRPAKQRAKKAS